MVQVREQAVDRLIREYYFKSATAEAYIEFKGCCGYCGADLIGDRVRYWAGTIDHLLARTKYPDYIEVERNYAFIEDTKPNIKLGDPDRWIWHGGSLMKKLIKIILLTLYYIWKGRMYLIKM